MAEAIKMIEEAFSKHVKLFYQHIYDTMASYCSDRLVWHTNAVASEALADDQVTVDHKER